MLKGVWIGNYIVPDATVSAAAPVTVPIGLGALTITGFAPTVAVSNNIAIAEGLGALALTGFAETVVIGTVASPGLGALTLTGFAPSVVLGTVIAEGLGALTLSGFSPTPNIGVNVGLDVGALSLAGFAPTVAVTQNQTVPLDVGALTLGGLAPTVVLPVTVPIGLGALSLTGFAPAVVLNTIVATDVGALTLSGFAPTATAGTATFAAPDVGSLTLTGYEPSVVGDATIARLGGMFPALRRKLVPKVKAVTTLPRDYVPKPEKFVARLDPKPVAVMVEPARLYLDGFAPVVVITEDAEPETVITAPPVRAVREAIATALDIVATQAEQYNAPVPAEAGPAERPSQLPIPAYLPPTTWTPEPAPAPLAPAPVLCAMGTGALTMDSYAPTAWTAPRPWDATDDALLVAALYLAWNPDDET